MSLLSRIQDALTSIAVEINAIRDELVLATLQRVDITVPVPASGVLDYKWAVIGEITIDQFAITAGDAPSGGSEVMDVHYSDIGVTIFTTQGNRPTLTTGTTQGTGFVPDVTNLTAGGYLEFHIDTHNASCNEIILSMFYRVTGL